MSSSAGFLLAPLHIPQHMVIAITAGAHFVFLRLLSCVLFLLMMQKDRESLCWLWLWSMSLFFPQVVWFLKIQRGLKVKEFSGEFVMRFN